MSQANYILICSGRGRVKTAQRPSEQVSAAMECAAQFVEFNQLIRPQKMVALEDEIRAVAALQHKMMEALPHVKQQDASEMTEEMFAKLDALEKKFS